MMNLLKNLDLYKAMILGSLLLLPLAGGFVYWVEGRLQEAQQALNAARRSGGELEKIGKIETQLNTIKQNVEKGGSAEKPSNYFERQIIGAANDGRLSVNDLDFGEKEERVTKQSAVDREVTITFTGGSKAIPLNREFIWAMLLNCESQGSQTWKLRQLNMANAEAAGTGASRGRSAPPRTVADHWQIKKLIFARREPDKSRGR